MRRTDREITELADVLAVLDRCEVMRVGFCVDDQPYIVPMNFAYEVIDDKIAVYFHCAGVGRKLDMLRRNSRVCFEADCSYRTLEAESACSWSAEYESVMGEGDISILQDEAEKTHALDVLMARHGFVGVPQYDPVELAAITALRISVTSITGKRNLRS